MGSRAGMACTRMHTKDKGVGKGDGPNHHREGRQPDKHTPKGGVPALRHRLRHTPKGGVPACTPPAAQGTPRPAGHSGTHLRRQGLPTSGGTPIVHARAGGHGLLLSSTGGLAGGARHSSPGADQHGRVAMPCMGSRKRRAGLQVSTVGRSRPPPLGGDTEERDHALRQPLVQPSRERTPAHAHEPCARVRADDPKRHSCLCGEGRKGDSGPARFVPALVAPSNALFRVTLETGPPHPNPQPYGMRVICVLL